MRGIAGPMSAAWTVCPTASSRRTSVDAMNPARVVQEILWMSVRAWTQHQRETSTIIVVRAWRPQHAAQIRWRGPSCLPVDLSGPCCKAGSSKDALTDTRLDALLHCCAAIRDHACGSGHADSLRQSGPLAGIQRLPEVCHDCPRRAGSRRRMFRAQLVASGRRSIDSLSAC